MKSSRMIKITINVLGLMILWLVQYFTAFAQSPQVIDVGKFSAAKVEDILPANWKPLTFKKIERHTVYSLIKDDDTVVVRAVAEASASGLIREIRINPKEYPIVQWRWKVTNVSRPDTTNSRPTIWLSSNSHQSKFGYAGMSPHPRLNQTRAHGAKCAFPHPTS